MKILFYTSGIPGVGRIVHGIAIRNAFARLGKAVDFTIVSGNPLGSIAEPFGCRHRLIPLEDEHQLGPGTWESSRLYEALADERPDILLVDKQWFTLHHFIDRLPGKKVFLCLQVRPEFFSISLPEGPLLFNPSSYDRLFAIEPFEPAVAMEQIDPLIIRNRDEILPRDEALRRLGLSGKKPVCFIGVNFKEGAFAYLRDKYSYLDGPYQVILSTLLEGKGVFPIADYYNAIDLVVSLPGYNQFWETVYFGKEALFEPVAFSFTDGNERVNRNGDYHFTENGADRLAAILIDMASRTS